MKKLRLGIAFLLFALSVAAQSGVTPEMRTAANDTYQRQDWKAAVAAYEKIVAAEEKNVGARYRLGISLLGVKANADAQKHLEIAMRASPNPVFGAALARAHARLGEREKMFTVLEQCIKLGGISPDTLNSETDFAAFRGDAKFADIVKRSDMAVNPCKASPSFREFDFWIGEWDAKNAQGVTVGSSSIQLILGQCVISENWSTPVSSGKSYNIYNAADKKWHQTWVDDKGTLTKYVGGIVDGKMVLDSEAVANGKKVVNRMTFSKLADGSVRQHGETSQDDGKTWTTTFDFTYVRRK